MVPAMAHAPSTAQNGGIYSQSDAYVIASQSPELPPRSVFDPKDAPGGLITENYAIPAYVLPSVPSLPPPALSPVQEEWRDYLKSLTTPEEYKILSCIAQKESRWQMKWNYLHDTDPDKYTAYGIFQILSSTAFSTDSTLDRFDPLQNIELAVKLYRKSGSQPWLVAPLCVQ